MIQNKQIAERLVRLNAGFSIRYEAPSYAEDDRTGKPKQISPGRVHCDIFDLTVKQTYATATAEGESEAVRKALDAAEQAPKPLTPAQRADVEANRSEMDELRRRAEAAEAELAELRSGSAPKRGRGRNKPPAEEPDDGN